ncbi:MAG: hypothetical protein AB7T01_01150 [Acidithiobacillus sp.]|uniref:hypothetical protein n=2 Tax=Acidithiobacillus TaxID=119977 RepID=UPI00094B085B|nr:MULTISPECIES: hypothetical protein [Acidithiobacillus]MBE7566345.1 hypothetical protein [Acidithiobacillus sp. HP-11]MBU2740749.1 hypothetical protein [Acidithiobacillus albertensis]MBU2793761.1 hypothetical protein [Acidithiobacillus thiooxidans]MCR2829067.1 hypothetical protein [Acidithiobacillus ferrooxidans]
MSTEHFRITYDGPALDTHEMDVRDLAPALLSLADACDAASQALFGPKSKMVVNVKASFKTGSFGVDLTLASCVLQSTINWFAGKDGQGLANATAVLLGLGAFGGGVIAALKWLRGRKIHRIDIHGNKRILITEDEDQLEIEEYTLILLQHREFREKLEKALDPLDCDGIETIALGRDESVDVTVSKKERGYFVTPPATDEILFSEERTQAFSIANLAFQDGNKWRLYDGQATVFVSIEDTDFLLRVNTDKESFAKSDVLICRVRVTQWQTDAGVKTDYAVLKVLEHKTHATQLKLPTV